MDIVPPNLHPDVPRKKPCGWNPVGSALGPVKTAQKRESVIG
jgi:hypothetical protein